MQCIHEKGFFCNRKIYLKKKGIGCYRGIFYAKRISVLTRGMWMKLHCVLLITLAEPYKCAYNEANILDKAGKQGQSYA